MIKFKKTIALIGILLFTLNSYAQYGHEGFYVSAGYELGLLSVDLNNDANIPSFKNSEVNSRLRHSIPISVMYRTPSGFDFELGYFPSQNNLSFKGADAKKRFKVSSSFFSHTAFAGINYNIPLTKSFDFRLGVSASMTFVSDEKGEDRDNGGDGSKIKITNETVTNNNIHLIAPISIVKHLRNGNSLTIGAKYYHSINKSFIKGTINIEELDGTAKQVNYNTLNNAIAVYISYGFNIQPERSKGCGCLF